MSVVVSVIASELAIMSSLRLLLDVVLAASFVIIEVVVASFVLIEVLAASFVIIEVVAASFVMIEVLVVSFVLIEVLVVSFVLTWVTSSFRDLLVRGELLYALPALGGLLYALPALFFFSPPGMMEFSLDVVDDILDLEVKGVSLAIFRGPRENGGEAFVGTI